MWSVNTKWKIIKRKKSWRHLTKCYNFKVKKQKNKQESSIQREEIYVLLQKGTEPKEIVKIGYPNSVVHRCKKKLEIMKGAVWFFGSTGKQ